MRLKTNLLLGVVMAFVAFLVGTHSGPAFIEGFNLVNREAVVNAEMFTKRYPVFPSAVGTVIVLGCMGISLTLFHLVWFALKYRSEHKRPHDVGEFNLGNTAGVNLLAVSFAMAAFMCGFFESIFETSVTVALLAIAALPTILQLIDLAGQERGKRRR